MGDSPRHPDADHTDDADLGPAPNTPRWVKVFGIALIVLVLLFIVMIASGHGPGRHMAGLDRRPPVSVTENVRQS
jgi:hypothetical protein